MVTYEPDTTWDKERDNDLDAEHLHPQAGGSSSTKVVLMVIYENTRQNRNHHLPDAPLLLALACCLSASLRVLSDLRLDVAGR